MSYNANVPFTVTLINLPQKTVYGASAVFLGGHGVVESTCALQIYMVLLFLFKLVVLFGLFTSEFSGIIVVVVMSVGKLDL